MRLGVDPKIDYAFKRLFGMERNRDVLIDLIDSVLQLPPEQRISDIQILNPFNEKETLDDKLSIVDIKARDQLGRQYNIEMQMLAYQVFRKRVLYYWAKLYQQQLHESDDYLSLKPTISICFLDSVLFSEVPDYHLKFKLLDAVHGLRLTEDLEIHLLELPKFLRRPEELVDPLDRWLYFMRYAEQMDVDAFPDALDTPVISRAMEELKMLTQNDLERERYEARVKLQRDAITSIKAARLEGIAEGRKDGLVEGHKEGLVEGHREGLIDGWKEGLFGRISLCQRLLKRPVMSAEQLAGLSLQELARLADSLELELQQKAQL